MVRTESQLNKQAKHTKFKKNSERISIAEHSKLVAESSDFHLTLRVHFFPTRNTQKKQDILSQERESGMTLKKREFTPESGTVDTYVMVRNRPELSTLSKACTQSSIFLRLPPKRVPWKC